MIATVFGTMLDPLIVTLIVASVVAPAAIVTDIGPVNNHVISTESVIVIALVVAVIIALIVSVLEPSSSPSCPCLAFALPLPCPCPCTSHCPSILDERLILEQ